MIKGDLLDVTLSPWCARISATVLRRRPFSAPEKTTRYGVERRCLTIYFVISLFLLTSLPWLPHCFSMTSIFRYFAGKVWENYFAFIFLINILFQAAEQGSEIVVKQVRVALIFNFFIHDFCLPGSFQAEFCFSHSFPLSKQVELQI